MWITPTVIFQRVYYEKLPKKEPTGLVYQEYNRQRAKKAKTNGSASEANSDLLTGNFVSFDKLLKSVI